MIGLINYVLVCWEGGMGGGGDVPTADEFPSLEGLMSNITRYIEFTFVVEARKKLTLVQHITSKHQEY